VTHEKASKADETDSEALQPGMPEGSQLAKAGCKPYNRLNVKIGDDDELGTFIFRTTG
jgi:hypothetical protein